jgi:hypothetical protein
VPYAALDTVHLGYAPPVQAGEIIPETYPDMVGDPQPVDFERLVELGVAEKVSAAAAKKAAADAE